MSKDDDAFVKVWHLQDINKNMFIIKPLFNWAEDWGQMFGELLSVIS